MAKALSEFMYRLSNFSARICVRDGAFVCLQKRHWLGRSTWYSSGTAVARVVVQSTPCPGTRTAGRRVYPAASLQPTSRPSQQARFLKCTTKHIRCSNSARIFSVKSRRIWLRRLVYQRTFSLRATALLFQKRCTSICGSTAVSKGRRFSHATAYRNDSIVCLEQHRRIFGPVWLSRGRSSFR